MAGHTFFPCPCGVLLGSPLSSHLPKTGLLKINDFIDVNEHVMLPGVYSQRSWDRLHQDPHWDEVLTEDGWLVAVQECVRWVEYVRRTQCPEHTEAGCRWICVNMSVPVRFLESLILSAVKPFLCFQEPCCRILQITNFNKGHFSLQNRLLYLYSNNNQINTHHMTSVPSV